ncbi:MAG TPA: M23 family metallopeptidase [Spirochaetia bacterium]|nr:M23 family metallopeptidase [Spirochaetia bacterium]
MRIKSPVLKPLYLSLFLLVSVCSAYTWQWPLSPVVLVHTFGDNDSGRFRLGDALAGADSKVESVSSGSVVYSFQSGGRTSVLPSVLGNFVVVQHPDGFRSIYSHLATVNPPSGNFGPGTILGSTGMSGIAQHAGLDLRIVDMKLHRMVNPMAVLPSVRDRLYPEVHGLYIHASGTPYTPMAEGIVVQPGRWEIAADIADQGQGSQLPAPVAPFGLGLELDGKQITHISLEYISLKDGDLYIDRDHRWDFKALYRGPFLYNLGEVVLAAGPHTLRIRVSDFAGNETVIDRHIVVAAPAPSPALPEQGAVPVQPPGGAQ